MAAVDRAYRVCRRRKRGTANAQRYEHRLLDHLVDTAQALQDRTYAPSRSLCFVARQPKAREIHAADFRDRVVHHVLVPRLEVLFEPVFIHDLYAHMGKKMERWTCAASWDRRAPARRGPAATIAPSWCPAVPALREVTDGANFLGYIVRPDYRLVRRRVIGNLRVKLAAFARDQVTATALRLPPGPRDRLRAELASYLGHFGHADAWRLVHSLFVRDPWLGLIFRLREGRLVPRWEPSAATSLRGQVVWFRRALRPAMLLVQIGNRVALFEPDLGLALARAPWLGRWRSARTETRPGLTPGLSWPVSCIKGLGRSLRQTGQAYAFIAEEGYLPGGLKRRVLRYLFIGPTTATTHQRG